MNPHKVGITVPIWQWRKCVSCKSVFVGDRGRARARGRSDPPAAGRGLPGPRAPRTDACLPHPALPCHRKKRLAQLHQQTACFSLLWKIYSLNYFFHYKYYAQLAAMMQVNTALETQNAFQVRCSRCISSGA